MCYCHNAWWEITKTSYQLLEFVCLYTLLCVIEYPCNQRHFIENVNETKSKYCMYVYETSNVFLLKEQQTQF